MDTFVDYYEILGISEDASEEEIREAYIKKALKHHPDRHNSDGLSASDATAQFQQVAEAYFVLSDRGRRQEYDDARRSRSPSRDTNGWAQRQNAASVNPNHVFGNVFEEMLRPEVDNPKFLWTPLGGMSGAIIGFIVGNIPGAVLVSCLGGGYGGAKLGAVRDNKGGQQRAISNIVFFSSMSRLTISPSSCGRTLGVSVYDAFCKLSRQQKSAILNALAAKIISG
ncbi:DnaJ domain-containing protein [Jimgerdemannia flammicorona]|uniref:DnaJ domain-containing protein n=1 Tax=Jimgerdemannia flammicorona TaxID=994334 RepID=A0A433QIH2_9FUNG|nr:DnaJ domain-containing protein [Jimgerdemannia flammicorona]